MNAEYRIGLPSLGLEDTDEKARTVLEKAQAQVGFIPNMYRGMANSAGLLETYLDGYARFRAASGFSAAEQEVIFLTISRFNGCDYCMAAHSMIAEKKSGVSAGVLAAIRAAKPIPDARLAALSEFTTILLETRGLPSRAAVSTFIDADFGERQILEIILAIAVKTLSNYSNHLFHTDVDQVFAAYTLTEDA